MKESPEERKKREAAERLKRETDLDWLEWGLTSEGAKDKLKDTDKQQTVKKKEAPKKK